MRVERLSRPIGRGGIEASATLWRTLPPIPKENIMRRLVTMVLASAALVGSLIATDAQARGAGGGGRIGGFKLPKSRKSKPPV
jgi:hypothetical protein